MPALAAGIFIFCGFAKKLPRGTFINGVDVGGMTRPQAVALVRDDILSDLDSRSLKIISGKGEYAFSYPEISFKDDVKKVAESVRRAGEYSISLSWYLNGLDSVVSGICAAESEEVREPRATFNGGDGEPFLYEEGKDGALPDAGKLKRDILSSLKNRVYGGDFAEVALSVKKVAPSQDMAG